VIVVLVFYFDGVGIGHGFLSCFLFNCTAFRNLVGSVKKIS